MCSSLALTFNSVLFSLYVEQVDVGEDAPRTIISGLVKYVPIEEMQVNTPGQRVVHAISLCYQILPCFFLSCQQAAASAGFPHVAVLCRADQSWCSAI